MTIIIYLVVVAVAWFGISQYLAVVQSAGRAVSASVGGIDGYYIQADQFITGLVMGFLAIGVFALGIWVYQYSQAKSLMIGGG